MTGIEPMTSRIFIHFYSLITTVLLYVPGNIHKPNLTVRPHCKEGLSKANVFDGKHKAKIEKTNIHVRGTDLLWTMHLGAKEGEASQEMQRLTLHLFVFLAKEFTLEFTGHLSPVGCHFHCKLLFSLDFPQKHQQPISTCWWLCFQLDHETNLRPWSPKPIEEISDNECILDLLSAESVK